MLCVLMCVRECLCVCMGICKCICVRGIPVSMYICVRVSSFVFGLRVTAIQTRLLRSRLLTRDLDLRSLWTDTETIRKLTDEMIRVRTVKT